MIFMHVLGLTLDRTGNAPILVLRQTDPPGGQEAQTLPVWVGVTEAMHLSMALNQVRIRRPLPHGLLLSAIAALGGRISGVSLTGLREGTFYARIDVAQGESVRGLDCRPSDAVLLALRAGLDIMVDEAVIRAAAQGRIRPGAPDSERRPLDSAEALIREAGQQLLQEAAGERGSGPGVAPGAPDGTLRDPGPPFGGWGGAAEHRGPGRNADGAAETGRESDEEKLTELLRRLEPASRRVM